MFDAKAMGEQFVIVVRDYCARAVAPLLERLSGVERQLADLPPPKVDMVALSGELVAAAAKAIEALPKPKDGVDYDPDVLEAAVARHVAALQVPKDGESPDPQAIAADVLARVMKALPEPQKGDRGEDADPAAMLRAVHDEVAHAFAAMPRPKDGDKPTAEELAPLVDLAVSKAFAALPPPKGPDAETLRQYAAEILPGMVDKAQSVLSDRLEAAIAAIAKPKDGESVTVDDVRPMLEVEVSRSLLDFERRLADTVQRAIENIPKPKDGNDGVGIDDFDAELDADGRTILLSFRVGERQVTKSLRLAIPVDRGVYRAGSFQKGDGVTYAGSFWIAQADTSESPGAGSPAWRLAVKRGR